MLLDMWVIHFRWWRGDRLALIISLSFLLRPASCCWSFCCCFTPFVVSAWADVLLVAAFFVVEAADGADFQVLASPWAVIAAWGKSLTTSVPSLHITPSKYPQKLYRTRLLFCYFYLARGTGFFFRGTFWRYVPKHHILSSRDDGFPQQRASFVPTHRTFGMSSKLLLINAIFLIVAVTSSSWPN